jgi:hypothetical protein
MDDLATASLFPMMELELDLHLSVNLVATKSFDFAPS